MQGFDVYPAAEAFTRRGWRLVQASVVGGWGRAALDHPCGDLWGVSTVGEGFEVYAYSGGQTLTFPARTVADCELIAEANR